MAKIASKIYPSFVCRLLLPFDNRGPLTMVVAVVTSARSAGYCARPLALVVTLLEGSLLNGEYKIWPLFVQTLEFEPIALKLLTPNPMSVRWRAWAFALVAPEYVAVTLYCRLLLIATGTVTLTMLFVFDGEISPKLIVTTRSLSTLELPVTDPLFAPVIVGAPPLEMSRAWAGAVPMPPINSSKNKIRMLDTRLFILMMRSFEAFMILFKSGK